MTGSFESGRTDILVPRDRMSIPPVIVSSEEDEGVLERHESVLLQSVVANTSHTEHVCTDKVLDITPKEEKMSPLDDRSAHDEDGSDLEARVDASLKLEERTETPSQVTPPAQ